MEPVCARVDFIRMPISPLKAALGVALAMGAVALATTASAYDDRPATPAEHEAIERAVLKQGYVSIEEIAMDDGFWEADDARDASGREWDLKLDLRSYKVVRRVEDL